MTRPAIIAAATLSVVLSTFLWPSLFGLSGRFPWVQVVAMRGLVAVVGAVATAMLAGVSQAARIAGRWPRLRAVTAGAAVSLLAFSAGHAGVLVMRTLPADAYAADSATDLTVMTFNTGAGATSPSDVVDAVIGVDADIVALPETSAETAADIAAGLVTRGRPMQVAAEGSGHPSGDDPVHLTSLLISEALGRYAFAPGADVGLGSVVGTPEDGDGPVVAAVHPPPPLPVAIGMGTWRRQVRTAADICGATAAIVAGDFNATADHAVLQDLDGCVLSSVQTGDAATGTWPSSLPRALGAAIDHVLVDPRHWIPETTTVLDIAGSDHRAVVVQLRRSAG